MRRLRAHGQDDRRGAGDVPCEHAGDAGAPVSSSPRCRLLLTARSGWWREAAGWEFPMAMMTVCVRTCSLPGTSTGLLLRKRPVRPSIFTFQAGHPAIFAQHLDGVGQQEKAIPLPWRGGPPPPWQAFPPRCGGERWSHVSPAAWRSGRVHRDVSAAHHRHRFARSPACPHSGNRRPSSG